MTLTVVFLWTQLLASGSYDDTIKLYLDDPSDDWYCYQTLSGHTSTVWSLCFSPCGRFLASGSDDATVRIWRRLTKEQAELQGLKVLGEQPGRQGDHWACTNVLKGWHTRSIYSVSWGSTSKASSSDRQPLGRIASCGSDGSIFVYEVHESADLSQSVVPRVEVVARMEAAHGVHEANSVGWAPRSIARDATQHFPDSLASAAAADQSAAAKGRFEELGEEEQAAEEERNRRAGGHSRMCDLLASTGDDGSVRVWAMPDSPFVAQSA